VGAVTWAEIDGNGGALGPITIGGGFTVVFENIFVHPSSS
jgi:hypothetical protein